MLAGLLSKAILVILPFTLLLLDYWPLQRAGDPWGPGAWSRWKPRLIEKIPLFLLSGLFVVINLSTHVSGSGADSPLSWTTRLGLITPNVWPYLGKIFWPVRLAIFHPEHDVVSWPLAVLSGALWLGIALAAFRRRRQPRTCSWAGCGFSSRCCPSCAASGSD
jgi:protein O-mannosyl-transferase